jgi:hypothetical protein
MARGFSTNLSRVNAFKETAEEVVVFASNPNDETPDHQRIRELVTA